VTKRKTKLLALQILLFIIAVILIYLTYYKKNDSISQNLLKDDTLKQTKTTDDENFFEDVQYRGVDLNGNRYLIESETARFNSKKPDDIFMSKMVGYFYFKDGSVLRIESDNGKYNNQTQDTQFRDNIKAEHKENVLFADNIDYLNQKGLLKIYGNIKGKTGRGEIFADMVSYDLKRGSLDISMFNNNLIDVRVKER
tara:strand:- start:2136 stop:2726 length:591 start_codon:yes stop_codon:yes gene_type:complete